MVPELHEQWQKLDFTKLFTRGAAFLNMDAQNSILNPQGCLTHERIWHGANEPGGSLHNMLGLAAVCRKLDMPFVWLRYDRFIGEREPCNEMDRVQYSYWNREYPGDQQRKVWECDLIPEVKAIMRKDDLTLVYPGWSIFTGTPVDRWLKQWGVQTLILSGYHTDWCVEMATRHARELGYMPVVIGDACGTTQPLHDQTLAQINACYAPVVTTEFAIKSIAMGSPARGATAPV
ncbi:MAG: cysteine hydrolase [Pirellulales bacterium]|jgi:nicotinamidase-related amidase|nr:cysteine hydrolase [Pirellulales bacterium]